jgi:hypothetical protein
VLEAESLRTTLGSRTIPGPLPQLWTDGSEFSACLSHCFSDVLYSQINISSLHYFSISSMKVEFRRIFTFRKYFVVCKLL